MKSSRQVNPIHQLFWLSIMILAAYFIASGCGDDDDDSDKSDDDADAPECTVQDACERHVECNIIDSVDECVANVETCPDPDAFAACLCECQAQGTGCEHVEPCIPVCIESDCQ